MALRLGMSSQHSTTTAAHLGEVTLLLRPLRPQCGNCPLSAPRFRPRPTTPRGRLPPRCVRGDSIDRSLKQCHVPSGQLERLYQALYAILNPAQVKPGDYYEVAIDTSDVIRRFCYTPHRTPDRPIEVELRDGQFVARQLQLPLERRVERLEVRIEEQPLQRHQRSRGRQRTQRRDRR